MKPYYEKLRELREGQDLKQSDVALVLGTTQQFIPGMKTDSMSCRCAISLHYAGSTV